MTHDQVVYSRSRVFDDGSQQIEQFVLPPWKLALLESLLGEPQVTHFIAPEQAQHLRDSAGLITSLS